MFAIEISFQDGISRPVMVLERRPQAIIGGTEYAHVYIEDMKNLKYQVRLVRDLGRRFKCKAIGSRDISDSGKNFEGTYEGSTLINLETVKFQITSLDVDLALKDNEPPDKAGVRVLRQAVSTKSPRFPALVVRGSTPLVMSFVADQPIYLGRSKVCALRVDASDVSSRHARMGYEGGQFWVEDLGSTNGTFVNQQQISGRVNLAAGVPIVLGREISVFGVTSEDQITLATNVPSEAFKVSASAANSYPVLLAVSEVVRPARLVMQAGASVKIGRDPNCEMWLGAPHVSRHHCTVSLTRDGLLSISDNSTNGTAYDGGILNKGDVVDVHSEPLVLDFGGNLTVAVCFNEEQEKMFAAAHGVANVFSKTKLAPRPGPAQELAEVVGTLTGLRAVAREAASHGLSRHDFVFNLKRLYSELSFYGKMMLFFIFLAVPLLVVILLGLILPIFQ